MRAVRCHRFAATNDVGKPVADPEPLRDVLSLDEVPTPKCGDGEVLIRVHYAGVQYPDALQAMGLYQLRPSLPYIPGMDVAGTVVEIGSGVTHVQPGDRVIAQNQIGGLAEYMVAPSDSVFRVPDGVPLWKVANIGRNYFAAYHSLRVLGDTGPKTLVLVDGASGGVGTATIQLAKAMGATVIAGVSSESKTELPRRVGADRVLTYGHDLETHKKFKGDVRQAAAEFGHPKGVDLVVDVVQGELFEGALLSVIRPLGKICLVGFTGGQKPIRPGLILIKQADVIGSLWGPWAQEHPEAHRQHVAEILGYIADGAIDPPVENLFEFNEFIKAFELFEQNRGRGNTVVRVIDDPSDAA